VAGLATFVAADFQQDGSGRDREQGEGELPHRELDGRKKQRHPQIGRDQRHADENAKKPGGGAHQPGLIADVWQHVEEHQQRVESRTGSPT